MTDDLRPPPRPAGAAAAATGRSRHGPVLLVDLAPPAAAPLAAYLGALGADLVDLDAGGSDPVVNELAGALAGLARRASQVPARAGDLALDGRALLVRHLAARPEVPVVLSGSPVAEALDFFLTLAGVPDAGAVVLAGEPPAALAPPGAPAGPAGRRLAAGERGWRAALGRLGGAAVYVVADAGRAVATGEAARCARFLGLADDPGGAGERPPGHGAAPGGRGEGIFGVAAALSGPHPRFAPPELPPESLLSAAVAEAEAEAVSRLVAALTGHG